MDRIELLDKINFIWEAQRGGPRRKRRATVCVPPKPTPVQNKDPHILHHRPGRGRGGIGAAAAAAQRAAREDTAAMAVGSMPMMDATGFQAGLVNPAANGHLAQALANQRMVAAEQFAGNPMAMGLGLNPYAGVGSGFALNHPANLGVGGAGLVAARSQAAAFANMSQLDAIRQQNALNAIRQTNELNLIRAQQAAAPPGSALAAAQPWTALPHGGYQQPQPPQANPAASNSGSGGSGIFPIATPDHIAAAGYRLAMIPNGPQQPGAVPSGNDTDQALLASESERKRKAQAFSAEEDL